jgi:predicted Zn-ribbon and HTH transcriptional regulator
MDDEELLVTCVCNDCGSDWSSKEEALNLIHTCPDCGSNDVDATIHPFTNTEALDDSLIPQFC